MLEEVSMVVLGDYPGIWLKGLSKKHKIIKKSARTACLLVVNLASNSIRPKRPLRDVSTVFIYLHPLIKETVIK
jgi:hypothetical protein